MKKFRVKKTRILIVAYIILIIIELFFYVPYHNIQIFISNQMVPHTEILGSGYATMTGITWDNARVSSGRNSSTGKIVNTPQLFMNVSITTFLAVAIYFILQKKEEIKELPILDVNALAFATADEVKQAQRDYAKKMYDYVIYQTKGKGKQQYRGEQLTLFDIMDK